MQFAHKKTHIREASDGFDFLGWNFRLFKQHLSAAQKWKRAKGREVTLVCQSQKSIKSLMTKVKDTWRLYIGKEARLLIQKLNPILRGWHNYHRYVNANEAFRDLDRLMYLQAVRYARRKHSSKSWKWIVKRYFKESVCREASEAREAVGSVKRVSSLQPNHAGRFTTVNLPYIS